MEKTVKSEDCQKGYPPTSLHSFLMRHPQPSEQNSVPSTGGHAEITKGTEHAAEIARRRGNDRLTHVEELDRMRPGDTARVCVRIAWDGIAESDSTYLLNHEDLEVHAVLLSSNGTNAYRDIYIEGVPQTIAKKLIENYKALTEEMRAAYLRADIELAPSTGVSIPNELVAHYSLSKVELLTD